MKKQSFRQWQRDREYHTRRFTRAAGSNPDAFCYETVGYAPKSQLIFPPQILRRARELGVEESCCYAMSQAYGHLLQTGVLEDTATFRRSDVQGRQGVAVLTQVLMDTHDMLPDDGTRQWLYELIRYCQQLFDGLAEMGASIRESDERRKRS